MARISNGDGAGGSLTNLAGKGFEEDVFLNLLEKINAYYRTVSFKEELNLSPTQEFIKIFEEDVLIGAIGTQSSLFKYLGAEEYIKEWSNGTEVPEQIKDVWEKDLIPDLFILNFRNDARLVTLIEVKYQNDSGSVDEKLQTGMYKREMWNKLFRNLLDPDEEVNYAYILSNWFAQPSKKPATQRERYYADTFDYLDSIGVPYWINSNDDYQDKVVDGVVKYKPGTNNAQQMYLHAELNFPGLDILTYLN